MPNTGQQEWVASPLPPHNTTTPPALIPEEQQQQPCQPVLTPTPGQPHTGEICIYNTRHKPNNQPFSLPSARTGRFDWRTVSTVPLLLSPKTAINILHLQYRCTEYIHTAQQFSQPCASWQQANDEQHHPQVGRLPVCAASLCAVVLVYMYPLFFSWDRVTCSVPYVLAVLQRSDNNNKKRGQLKHA